MELFEGGNGKNRVNVIVGEKDSGNKKQQGRKLKEEIWYKRGI